MEVSGTRGRMTSVGRRRLLLCPGAAYAGPRWVARMLAEHPDVFVPPLPDLHYLDHRLGLSQHLSDAKRRSRRRRYVQRVLTQWGRSAELGPQWGWYRHYARGPVDDAWYAKVLDPDGRGRVAVDITPDYVLAGRDGMAALAAAVPGARVVYLMRNPVTRMWTHMLHTSRDRGRDAAREPLEALVALAEEPWLAAHADYGRALDNLEAAFGASHVLAMFTEELMEDRAGHLERICALLDIPFHEQMFPELARRAVRSDDIAVPDAIRAHLRRSLQPTVEAVRQRLGRIPQGWEEEFAAAV